MRIRSKLREIKRALKQPGGMQRKIVYYRFSQLAKRNGVIDFRIDRVATEYTHDYLDYDGATKEEKKWFYPKGIASYKLKYYGINKENYKDYISDFDFYHKRNYMNREFEEWFEHKLNTYYLLSPFKDSMPRHYYFAKNKGFLPIDVPEKRNGKTEEIIDLIKQKPIAAKAVKGGHGIGFYKLEYKNHKFYVNNEEKKEEEFKQLVKGLDNYIITDYVKPHKKFAQLCGDDTFSVMRVIMVYDENDGPQMTAAIIRLGSKKAGVVTDYEGTIYCGLTLEEGKTFNPIYRVNDDVYEPLTVHPDTGNELVGFTVPNWDELKKLAVQVSAYIPMTPYLVIDIIPTDDGFSILEINSHGQVRVIEPFYPFLQNPYNRKVFNIDN